MRKTNSCLRGLFIGFNTLFAVIGCLMIFGTIKATAYSDQLSSVSPQGLVWSWVISIGILSISCLGIYAGYSEKIVPLKIFAGFMGVGMIIMIIFGIVMAAYKSQVSSVLENLPSDVVDYLMSNQETSESLKELQHSAYCCGVLGPEDWGTRIPDSCSCIYAGPGLEDLFGTSSCRSTPDGHDGPDEIYARPCREVIVIIVNLVFKIAMIFFFSFSFIALLSLVASLFMIHQVKRSDVGAPIPMKGY
ncbi:23 kDa integral membrane protein-like [Gouania willdenowi]|uniref:23 kDa integral membrane protein-like n=1 Tax=Gouania willdenowi TaxID=441366 RepID=A0A8C5D2A2_GOUWI|nr:23 kDa integral membrane protein-like [Gouania willdenowi]